MLPNGSIHARHVWKRFRADRRRNLLRDEFDRFRTRIRGGYKSRWQWALRDIDLHAVPGESIGLVGINGSGKSTLLKILTRVMYPYAGRVTVAGRVGALINVSAGIHPELTGRENIYLSGSLLGLRRREITNRFDDIVTFAELERAIDRQVKFYSSGMNIRLGFAVASFLEPDVLLVDEVLAVGDASFQQKCLDRMRTVLAQGTTLVFVSHALESIEAACSRGVWIHDGTLQADGPVRQVLGEYRRLIEEAAELTYQPSGLVRLLKAQVEGPADRSPETDAPLRLTFVIESPEPRAGTVCFGISEGPGTPIFTLRRALHMPAGETEVRCTIGNLPLARGRYYLWMAVLDRAERPLLNWHPAAHFEVVGPTLDPPPRAVVRMAPIHVSGVWEVERY
jgi:ABC-type polysaccharide/polyol phosphate transport system ATPase subunit